MTIKRIAIDSIFLALLIVSSYISIPLSDISLTLQVLVVLLLALILPFIDAEIIIIVYILMGLFGIPVFANFSAGFSKIFMPSFGFIISFLFIPVVLKLISFIKINKKLLKLVLNYFLQFLMRQSLSLSVASNTESSEMAAKRIY